jgi:hypothetical protein
MGKVRDLVGKQFGRWSVIGVALKDRYVTCRCKCGVVKAVFAPTLINGRSKSCGCFKQEKITKHGMCNDRFYNIWKNILRRTECDYATGYDNYGGRGISCCEEWHEFNRFKDDMYDSYMEHAVIHGEKNTTIERKDNNKGYGPDNCKWATIQEQQLNKQVTKRYLIDGERLTPLEISKKYNLYYQTVMYRLKHWPIEKVTMPPMWDRRVANG